MQREDGRKEEERDAKELSTKKAGSFGGIRKIIQCNPCNHGLPSPVEITAGDYMLIVVRPPQKKKTLR